MKRSSTVFLQIVIVLIGIGATRYTELGASTYLQPGDSALVRVYDTHDPASSELRQLVRDR